MGPRIRIPTASDFAPLAPALAVALHFPSPPESTTAILVLLHGLGDSEAPFAAFARNMALPGVLAISVRAPSPLPPALFGGGSGPPRHFHWGDDLTLAGGELDPDPGFERAAELLLGRLVRETIVERCGWETSDVLLFGLGQGGSLVLGLASRLRMGPRVEEVTNASPQQGEGQKEKRGAERGRAFKGVVSVGGPLPVSMIPTVSARPKAQTPVLLCRGSASEAVDEDAVEVVKREFENVRVVNWRRPHDGMPGNRDEMLPVMEFFAERLRGPW